MTLEERIISRRKDIKSDRLSMSIGELAGLYDKGELDIHPKFQRVLRWEDHQKSRLIESIILGIPIPPIFVAQDPTGKWDVVDGVQRLGTVFEFLGLLRDQNGAVKPPLVLSATHLLPELDGLVFKASKKQTRQFPPSLQVDFNRARLDLQILLRESDPATKYELFERLNTGGSIASDQEVRNCVLVWINEPLFDWLTGTICKDKGFQACVELTDRAEERQYRMELVLRFLAFRDMPESELKEIIDIGEFLNQKNRDLALSKSSQKQAGTVFVDTFALLAKALGPDAFRKFVPSRGGFSGGFLISAYEAVALGVAHNIAAWRSKNKPEARLKSLVQELWSKEEFVKHIGIGVPARDRIRWSVPFGRKHFQP